jgi:hypothetical protein
LLIIAIIVYFLIIKSKKINVNVNSSVSIPSTSATFGRAMYF